MKKLALCLITLMMFVGLVAPISAEEEDFVPSVTYKPSPDVLAVATSDDGQEILGYIEDENGNVVSTVYRDCVVVTSLEEALDEESDISDYIRNLLMRVYISFRDDEIDLSESCEGLDEVVQEALGQEMTAENLVIRDLFDIRLIHDECNEWLEKEGTTLTLKLKVDIEKDSFFQVLRYKEDKWEMVEEITNNNENDDENDDGTITITSEEFCPVAIVVPGEVDKEGFNWLWIILAIIAFIIGWFARKKFFKA